VAIGFVQANEGARKFEFELSKDEITSLNSIITQSNPGDSIQALTERLSNTRQPVGFGGREVKTYDEKDPEKVVAFSVMIYVKRQKIDPGVGGSVFVNFWFQNGTLTAVSTNSLEVRIKKELLGQSPAIYTKNQ
jgi:hypothetical protein